MKGMWLIWSIEHSAWWAQDAKGYVRRREFAGRFTFNDACYHVRMSNLLTENGPYEAMVKDDEWEESKKLTSAGLL